MIPFSEYMTEWLYGPQGYYAHFKAIGRRGDFYTAVSASPFFGATIAHHMIDLVRRGRLSARLSLVEIGAHQGYLMADMLTWIAQEAPALLETIRCVIVEPFPALRKAQIDYFRDRFGDDIEIRHVEKPDLIGARDAFVVANEIFDAFPCDLVFKGKTALVDDEHRIHFEGEDPRALKIAERYGRVKGEVARGYERFAEELFAGIDRGAFVSFDYGEKEIRTDFSIRVYKDHEVFPLFEEGLNLAELYGKSDLTYDVHFQHVIDAFEAAGFTLSAYKTQLRVLTEMGLPELLEQLAKLGDRNLYMRELNKIKTLLDPQLMGERFKMVEFWKGMDG